MLLSQLPLDVIRSILAWLDMQAIMKLNATFNRDLQGLLRSNGAVHTIKWTDLTRLRKAPLKYLLQSLRNVYCFELSNNAMWSPPSLDLLKTLNPLKLVLGRSIIHGSARLLEIDAKNNPNDLQLQTLASYMQPVGFPNLALLTTRLETLELTDYLQHCFESEIDPQLLALPPTLTHVCLSAFSSKNDPPIVDRIPQSIVTLEVGWCDGVLLPKIFERFTNLQTLIAHPLWLKDGPLPATTLAPASLTCIKANLVPSPLSLFSGLIFENCNLIELDLNTSSELDEQQLADGAVITFPNSLVSLALRTQGKGETSNHPTPTIILPSSLSSLALHQFNLSWEILEAFSSMVSLTQLSIRSDSKQTFSALPPNLKSLTLDRRLGLCESEIAALPRSLVFLNDASMTLFKAQRVRDRCPDCTILPHI